MREKKEIFSENFDGTGYHGIFKMKNKKTNMPQNNTEKIIEKQCKEQYELGYKHGKEKTLSEVVEMIENNTMNLELFNRAKMICGQYRRYCQKPSRL